MLPIRHPFNGHQTAKRREHMIGQARTAPQRSPTAFTGLASEVGRYHVPHHPSSANPNPSPHRTSVNSMSDRAGTFAFEEVPSDPLEQEYLSCQVEVHAKISVDGGNFREAVL